MKKKELSFFRTKKITEIKSEIVKKRKELAQFLVSLAAGREKNFKKGKNLKKDIAQMLTILKEREFLKK